MGRRNGWVGRWLTAAAVLAILLPSRDAEAVIPSAFGPIQALIVILPQLLLALAGLLLAVFKPRTYKLLGAYLWSHKVFTLVLVGAIAFVVWGPSFSGGKCSCSSGPGVSGGLVGGIEVIINPEPPQP